MEFCTVKLLSIILILKFAKFQLYILLSESWQKMKYLCSERSLIWPYQSLYERSLEERTSHYWHNEKHVGQIRIITIPKHIHSNYFPLIFWVISNDILTTTNITITQKHCRDDIFQKPTWITYFRSTLKKKKQLHEFSVKSLLQAFTHVFHWNFRTILFMRSHLLKASRNKSNIRSFYLSRFKQDQEPDYTWKLFSNTLTKFQWVVHKYNNLIA